MTLISILHATRGIHRFEMFWRAYDWCVTRAAHPDIEYIIGADDDDVEMIAALEREIKAGTRIKCPTKLVVGPKGQGNNGCWNNCYEHSTGKIIIQMSDDFECPKDWASRIGAKINAAGGVDKPLVVGIGDPHFMDDSSAYDAPGGLPPYSGDGLLSFYIATRAYIEQVGFLLHPHYISVFSDTELAQKAALDGCFVDAYEDIHFYHHWHGNPTDPKRDETYFRHLTTHCNNVGQQVLGNRFWAGCPDIYKETFPESRDMTDPSEGICPAPMPVIRDKILMYQRVFTIERFLRDYEGKLPVATKAKTATKGSGFDTVTVLSGVVGILGPRPELGEVAAAVGKATELPATHPIVASVAEAVHIRQMTTVKNKPFAVGSYRKAWLDGDWKTCRDYVAGLMARYHQVYCGGRFLFHAGHHLWYTCTKELGDKPLVGVREHHG